MNKNYLYNKSNSIKGYVLAYSMYSVVLIVYVQIYYIVCIAFLILYCNTLYKNTINNKPDFTWQ